MIRHQLFSLIVVDDIAQYMLNLSYPSMAKQLSVSGLFPEWLGIAKSAQGIVGSACVGVLEHTYYY